MTNPDRLRNENSHTQKDSPRSLTLAKATVADGIEVTVVLMALDAFVKKRQTSSLKGKCI